MVFHPVHDRTQSHREECGDEKNLEPDPEVNENPRGEDRHQNLEESGPSHADLGHRQVRPSSPR
jgi:hypothetical protein